MLRKPLNYVPRRRRNELRDMILEASQPMREVNVVLTVVDCVRRMTPELFFTCKYIYDQSVTQETQDKSDKRENVRHVLVVNKVDLSSSKDKEAYLEGALMRSVPSSCQADE